MNDILVDANVVAGFYREDVLGIEPETQNITGSAVMLFKKIYDNQDAIFLDDGGDQDGKIENEWKRNIPKDGKEWFDNWYFSLLHDDRIKYIAIDVSSAQRLLGRMVRKGFPQDGGDKWYARTASAIISQKCNGRRLKSGEILTFIVSEDIDFFEPTQKNHATGEARLDYLRICDGEIPNILRNHGIQLSCIENY